MKYESKIGEILEQISLELSETEIFQDTPIFYDFIEVDANNLPPSCIVYKPREWQLDDTGCNYQTQLDIILIITTEERREGIIGQLFMFREKFYEIMHKFIMDTPYYIEFLQGSPVTGFAYNRESVDSYKETKQLFTSMTVLSYLLRY